MSFIEFKDVVKRYIVGEQEIYAVNGVSFHIEQGEFCVIVGSSGAGKTTILNMLGGMDGCTSGTIKLDGEEVSAYSPRRLTEYRRFDVGFVFQFYNLVQNLTALENVELASEICKNPLDPKQTLEQVGLGHRLDNFPAQLSGGAGQKPQAAVVRRAYRRAGLRHRQKHPQAAAGHLPPDRKDGHRHHPQHCPYRHGRPGHSGEERQDRQQRGQS